jgi:hypothetical protein
MSELRSHVGSSNKQRNVNTNKLLIQKWHEKLSAPFTPTWALPQGHRGVPTTNRHHGDENAKTIDTKANNGVQLVRNMRGLGSDNNESSTNEDSGSGPTNVDNATEIYFSCCDKSRCIPFQFINDTDYDCIDGSDEAEMVGGPDDDNNRGLDFGCMERHGFIDSKCERNYTSLFDGLNSTDDDVTEDGSIDDDWAFGFDDESGIRSDWRSWVDAFDDDFFEKFQPTFFDPNRGNIVSCGFFNERNFQRSDFSRKEIVGISKSPTLATTLCNLCAICVPLFVG